MSYLSQPRIFFSGTFLADPSTVNNTPDNYNPNCNFPPANGADVGNNIQLYWNPNGTGEFALDCTVTGICNENGIEIPDDPLLGQPLVSSKSSPLLGAKLVDLDPMQQNVTELWGLSIQLGAQGDPDLTGDFEATAYSNAWVQVLAGRGDYAGSAVYQSVLKNVQHKQSGSSALTALKASCNTSSPELSISFVLRSFNSSSLNYLISDKTLADMNTAGVPGAVTTKLQPIKQYNQTTHGSGNPGQIPTTSYFQKLVSAAVTQEEFSQYWDAINTAAVLPYKGLTEFEFTHGQVFGVIGLRQTDEPEFMCTGRMLTPLSVTTDTASYDGYFSPFFLNETQNSVTVNLGNSLPSSQPASRENSYVAAAVLGELQLCYFEGGMTPENAVLLGPLSYQDNDFYISNAGLATLAIDPQLTAKVKTYPLGIISTSASGKKILIQENPDGYYLRANQFVFRMNPGAATSAEEPRGRTQEVAIYASKFGRPLANAKICISLMPSQEASSYTNGTLGTGGSSGLVNMSVPESAIDFPSQVTTDERGVAKLTLTAKDPGNPRGYVDGQIYFLNYGFSDPTVNKAYVQSPDDLISIQVYSQEPDIEEITWENYVRATLGLYGKLYPVMGFLDLDDEQGVIKNASKIFQAINRDFVQGNLMPVTRDLSSSRRARLNTWLLKHINPSGD